MEQAEATTLVSLLYQTILGREADPAGLRNKIDALVNKRASVTDLVRDFQSSPEFKDRQKLMRANLTGFPILPEATVFVAPSVIEALFTKTANYWRQTAAKPDEIYWSVLTDAKWKRELTLDDRRHFVATGADHARHVLHEFKRRTGRTTADVRCLDFGCGVGRLALNFAPHVAEVCAVDFSGPHLAELQKNAELFGCGGKVSTWLLEMPTDLAKVPQVDLVYSLIALQHNTPPVIAYVMESLLRHLRPGGLAFLHVTLARIAYDGFDADKYLADPEAGTTMEVHFLPRRNIEQVAQRAGCEVVGSGCIGGNYFAYSEEFVFRRADDGHR